VSDLSNTAARGQTWKFVTGVIQYLDSSMRFVTIEELQTVMAAQMPMFDANLIAALAANGNIACFEAQNDQGETVRYYCSTKFKPAR